MVPIYEYRCRDCEHKLEALQKISDEPLKFCPECGEESLRKLVSAAAFRLSGSGWYETDFKEKKQQKNLTGSDDKKPADDSSKKSEKEDGDKSPGTDKKESKTPAVKETSTSTAAKD